MSFLGFPSEKLSELKKVMKRQEGSLSVTYTIPKLLDTSVGKRKILDIVSGQIHFLLERESDLTLNFYHSSPGTGTRVASIDLNQLEKSEKFKLIITWTPKEIKLYIGSLVAGSSLIHSTGKQSNKKFIIEPSGGVIQVGDTNVKVKGLTIYQDGKLIVRPSALDIWKESKESIDVIRKNITLADYRVEVVLFNLVVVMLVTGFESYCKRRFIEIEDEGIKPNFDNLAKRFLNKEENELNLQEIIKKKATDNRISPTRELIQEGRINFQNFSHFKDAYNEGYGIKISTDVKDAIKCLQEINVVIKYRHEVIHVSPLVGAIEKKYRPIPETPKVEYIPHMIEVFDKFIQSLHDYSLNMKR